MFQAETVEIQPDAQSFADEAQEENVEKQAPFILFTAEVPGLRAQPIRPARGQQYDQKAEADRQVGELQAALGAIVTARFRGVGHRVGLRHGHFLFSVNSRVTKLAALSLLLLINVPVTPVVQALFISRWFPACDQARPPGARLISLVDEPERTVRSRLETATTRFGTAGVCFSKREPGGMVTNDITHWSDEIRRSTEAQADFAAASQGTGIEHDSVHRFTFVAA